MLPEAVSKLIGQRGESRIHEVERGAIKRFADAIDDPNPLYWDDEYANHSRYGSLIAPPGFFGWPIKMQRGLTFLPTGLPDIREGLASVGYANPAPIDAGIEYEFFLPIHVGDRLVATSMYKDIIEREGKTGKMAFMIIETDYVNQNGDLVCRSRSTLIQLAR